MTNINVKEKEEQRSLMKRSDFKVNSTFLKYFRKKD